jgi:hypothetical protein
MLWLIIVFTKKHVLINNTNCLTLFMSMVSVLIYVTFICYIQFNQFLVANMCSTSLPSGNQVDGFPPVSNTAVRDTRIEIGPIICAWEDSFALNFEFVVVFIIVCPQHPPEIYTWSRFCIYTVSNGDHLVSIIVVFKIFFFWRWCKYMIHVDDVSWFLRVWNNYMSLYINRVRLLQWYSLPYNILFNIVSFILHIYIVVSMW